MRAIDTADTVLVSPISFFEIAQKVRMGKWPQMSAFVQDLPTLLERQGGLTADPEPAICVAAGLMDWSHRDPFDRLLAASAKHYGVMLVSADTIFDGVAPRIW